MRPLRGGSPKSRGHGIYHVRQSNDRFRRELKTTGGPEEPAKGVQWHRVIYLILIILLIWIFVS